MAKQVTRYEALDGTLHETMSKARQCDAVAELESALERHDPEGRINYSQFISELTGMADNRTLLQSIGNWVNACESQWHAQAEERDSTPLGSTNGFGHG